MIGEIKAQLKRIESQIAAENEVYNSMKKYTESEIKAAVINQQIGVVRGLEVAKESLTYLLNTADDKQIKMEFEPMPIDGPEVMNKLEEAAARERRGDIRT